MPDIPGVGYVYSKDDAVSSDKDNSAQEAANALRQSEQETNKQTNTGGEKTTESPTPSPTTTKTSTPKPPTGAEKAELASQASQSTSTPDVTNVAPLTKTEKDVSNAQSQGFKPDPTSPFSVESQLAAFNVVQGLGNMASTIGSWADAAVQYIKDHPNTDAQTQQAIKSEATKKDQGTTSTSAPAAITPATPATPSQGQTAYQKGQSDYDLASAYLQNLYKNDPAALMKYVFESAAPGAQALLGGAAGTAADLARSEGLNAGQAALAGGQQIGAQYGDAFSKALNQFNQNTSGAQGLASLGLQESGLGQNQQQFTASQAQQWEMFAQQMKLQKDKMTNDQWAGLLGAVASLAPAALSLFL